ncbi:MAG TPA: serine/threonine-protein kinase [Polyangiaceae bacterium]|nr:serine/threonine-protein kinase [Polyangiaceae bacterium]
MDRRGVRTEHAVGATQAEASGTSEPADDSARVQAGQLIGRYRLLFPIAAGGMAEVWAAKPEGSGISRAVALKLVRPEFAVEAEYARMFIDEAVVASAIRHPNICETYELGRDENLLFMVMEWVAGDTLSGLMRGTALNPLPLEVAARICSEACAGLHAAHEANDGDGNNLGIVHRDVSPPNILVSVNGHVKVSDFGIAKAKNQLHARTRTGEIKGKLAYIPPEQVLGHGIDRRVDVYAMGCVLYVCTLGRRPFGSGGEALGKIVRGAYRKPRELEPDYPEELERIVMRSLASDRELRYQTAEEMRFELEQWLLTRPRPTQHGDVARLVRERISDDRRKMIDALTNVSRAIPDALSHRFISPADKTATPTATSGIVLQPAALARLKDKAAAPTPTPPKRAAEDDPTLLADSAPLALAPPTAAEASATFVERRTVSLPWLVALAALGIALLSLFILILRR